MLGSAHNLKEIEIKIKQGVKKFLYLQFLKKKKLFRSK